MAPRFHPAPRWTPGQRRALERAAAAGKLEEVTARKVRRSTDAVKAKRDRIGLPKDPTDPRQDALPGLPHGKPP